MFEFLKAFTGKLLGMISISKILEYQKNEKASEIGADLFMLYMSLNKIYANGLEIVAELERGLNWMEEKCRADRGQERFLTALPKRLENQKRELDNFIASFARLDAVLSVIDKDGYEKIRAFVYPKMGMLDYLLQSLGQDKRTTDVDFFFVDSRVE